MAAIAIIGAGSFGTALASLLGGKGHFVFLWARRKELADEINATHQNKTYLSHVTLPQTVRASSSLEECMKDASVVVLAVPSQYLRQTLSEAKTFFRKEAIIVHVIKGIDDSGKLVSQILSEELPYNPIAVLAGPNHAEEVAKNLPTATVIASRNKRAREHLCSIFSTPSFKTYPHDDIIGVEICGAVKNIVAIAIGVCDGLNMGDNAKGSILTLGLTEMGTIARRVGAKRATAFGLAGVGDLVATCFSKHSRNRFVGERLAQGKSMDEIIKEMHGMVAEGVKNSRIVHDLCKKHSITAPLITQAYMVLHEGVDLKKGIAQLLALV